MEKRSARWDYCGRLSEPDDREDGGTYLFIFEGDPKRIIYVGEADVFKNRWEKHLSCFKQGARAIWRVTTREDVYKLMAFDDHYTSWEQYSRE